MRVANESEQTVKTKALVEVEVDDVEIHFTQTLLVDLAECEHFS